MIDVITKVNDFINEIVWGVPIIILLLAVGLYFTIRLNFIQITKIPYIFKNTFCKIFKKSNGKGIITQGQAFLISLGSIVGTGNIAGVAMAISSGGPGALFWMWVAAFLGMATKFAEVTLGIFYRKIEKDKDKINIKGGPMYYLKYGLKSKFLAGFYAVMAIISYIIIAAVVDSNEIAVTLKQNFNIPIIYTASFLVVVVGFIIFGGVKRLGKFSSYFVPVMGFVYVVTGLVLIISNISLVGNALELIITSAFKPMAAFGGFAGASVTQIIKYGLARGMYSNEAGLGTSAITQSATTVNNPIEQSIWGITEVFIDTILINTITGLIIVMAGLWSTSSSGTILVMDSASVLLKGNLGSTLILIAALLFSFTCLTSSSYVCEEAMEYLFGSKSVIIIKVLWLVFIFVGSYQAIDLVWDLADTANGLMAIPNLLGLLLLSNKVIELKKEYFKKKGIKK